jgi:hypothetical protein
VALEYVRYEIDKEPDQRLIRSVGLAAIGQDELCVSVDVRRGREWGERVIEVLDYIAGYVLGKNARIRAGQTLEFGWTAFGFVQRAPGLLEVREIEDIFSVEPVPPVVPGVDRALRLTDVCEEVMRRNGLEGIGQLPYRGMRAICCKHLAKSAARHLFLDRDERDNLRDSGWLIDCAVNAGEHGADELYVEVLALVAAQRPFIVPYLALPVGSQVRFDEDGAFVFTPGREEGHRDPVDPYTFGPWMFDSAT